MKHIIGLLALTSSLSAMAVEGYQDIYLDKKADIIIHGVMCGDDLNNLNKLKPANVYTNTAEIEKGTYYFSSAYGEYSLTFNPTDNDAVMARGLLAAGKTSTQDMEKKLCIVKDVEGLPTALRGYLKKVTLKANDPNWAQTMKNYALVAGKPAFGKGEY
ncbi:hypothetical protein [Amphritea sp.]|uniref:hypothetical protein n=1 Tax=Amphritea sp. TaxID=1872502 RepID=UPI003A94EADD